MKQTLKVENKGDFPKIRVVNDNKYLIRWRESDGCFHHRVSTMTKLEVGQLWLAYIGDGYFKEKYNLPRLLQCSKRELSSFEMELFEGVIFKVKSLKDRSIS